MHLFHGAFTSLSYLTHHSRCSSEQCCSQAMVSNPQNVGNEPNITHGTFVSIAFYFFNMTWDQSGTCPLKAARTLLVILLYTSYSLHILSYLLWNTDYIFQRNFLTAWIQSKERVYFKGYSAQKDHYIFMGTSYHLFASSGMKKFPKEIKFKY